MLRDMKIIHQKNKWMLKLLAFFYVTGFMINIVVEQSMDFSNLFIGLGMLSIQFLLIYFRRWPVFTMLLTVCFQFIFFYFLIDELSTLISYISLGLAPLICLFYLDLRAVVLSSSLYIGSSVYFFYKFKDQAVSQFSSKDLVYIIVLGLFLLIFSIFYTKMSQRLLQRAESSDARLRTILEDVSIGIWTYDLGTMHFDVYEGFEQITGYPAHMFHQDPDKFRSIIHPDDEHLFITGQKEMMVWKTGTVSEYRIICYNGELKWIQNRSRPIVNQQHHLIALEGVVIDITERKQMEERIQFLAYHDELTGLANRTLLSNKFKECNRTGHPLAILFIDLDDFKEVNDTYGHAVGDVLLQNIASRILEIVREQDTVCRLGGDEFVILLTEIDESRVINVADRIRECLSQGFMCNGFNLVIAASIGIAVSGDGALELEELIREADGAMYDAKKSNEEQFVGVHSL